MFGTKRTTRAFRSVKCSPSLVRWYGRAACLLTAAALTLPMQGAQVKVVLDREAKVRAWAVATLPEATPSAGEEFVGREFTLTVPSDLSRGWLIVLDLEGGNVAYAPWDSSKTTWKVSDNDWRIAEVEVRATYDGKPAPGLAVLRSGNEESSRLLANGSAAFFGIPPGEVSVVIRYVHEGTQQETVPQRFELALKRAEPKPILAVALPEMPDDMAPTTQQDSASPPASAQTHSGSRKWLPILLALIVGAAALVGLYHLLRHHEDRVAESLRRLGVRLPSDQTTSTPTDGTAASDVSAIAAKPAEPEPITEGIQPVAAGGGAASSPPTSPLRLVGDGVALSLSKEGEYTIGREPSCELAIPDATVSRRHATLTLRAGALSVRDEGSTNGTYVNGVRLDRGTEHPVKPGDHLQLGSVKLRVEN
jgi:hypothetical protein